jgi:outer membrane protein OmpA-like peptidoglycan-associated protein
MMRIRAAHTATLAALALGAALGFSNSALAQAELDAERFKPAVTHDGFVTTEGSDVRPTADPFEFGLIANYGYRPLVIADSNGYVRSVVGGRLGMDLQASVSLFEPFAVGVDLPFFFAQTGYYDPDSAGLGKLRVVPKVRLLDDRRGFGLAILGELRLPTHTGDYSGNPGFEFVPKVAADHRFRSGIRVGGNLGVAIRESQNYYNVNTGSEFLYGAGVGYRFGGNSGKTEIGLDILGGVGLVRTRREQIPLELFGYIKQALSDEWELFGGPSVGLAPGYGIPVVRFFAGIRFAPTAHDRDHDGVSDDQDACPDIAEDRDADQDWDGCPEEDPDSDRDGVPDGQDLCPNAKETINGIADDDGCPDTGDPRVIYEDGKFTVLDTIRFETGRADIKPESHGLLDQVAQMIKANPDVKVRVEGHTDDTGPHDLNMRLSQERADSVRHYLAQKGVAPQRMRAVGYGPDKPLVKGTTEEARTKNRRVEFIVDDGK